MPIRFIKFETVDLKFDPTELLIEEAIEFIFDKFAVVIK